MSFEEWLVPFLPRLLRFATVLCGEPGLAEDVVQDVVTKAWGRWARVSTMQQPEAYLRRMVVNEHLSWRRRWSRFVPRAELVDAPESSTATFADQHADRAELIDELSKLPRRQRAVLVLRYFEGMSDEDIASTLGVSAGTVRSHASRALAALRVEMSPTNPARIDFEEDSRAY